MYLAEINEVIKASPAIQIQSKITHLQRRAWNVLLANAYNELPNTDIHHQLNGLETQSFRFGRKNRPLGKDQSVKKTLDFQSKLLYN